MNSLYLLGTGDGITDPGRNHSAYLYCCGEAALQIDCGEPAARGFKASGLSFDQLDALIISHLHSDHMGGLFMLIQTLWLEKRRRELTVYAPEDGIEPLRQMLRAAYLFDEALAFPLRFAPISAGRPIRTGSITVTPHLTTHLNRTRERHQAKYPSRYEAFCFLIENESGFRIGHSADLGAPTDLAPLLAKGLDLLVCELSHFTPDALFETLRGSSIQRLLLTHIARDWFQQGEALLKKAKSALPNVEIELARDGMRVPLHCPKTEAIS